LETNNILVDEQNGFRHIFVASSIIRNRLVESKSTFGLFIDFKKAFDFVNRDLLFYQLLQSRIDGRMYWAIKALYSNTECSVIINGLQRTQWFISKCGVRQGDNLSPTLFALFINDLAVSMKNLNIGINIEHLILSILLYADDILLLTASVEDVEQMISCIEQWCTRWRVRVLTMINLKLFISANKML